MSQKTSTLSTASGLGAIVLWSTTFAFARSLSEQIGPMTAGAAAYLIGGSLAFLRLAITPEGMRRVIRQPLLYLFGCGGLFAFYPAAIYLAVGLARNREQLLEIALVNYLWPSLTILFSLPILGKRANLWLIPGTALALGGVVLVMTQGASLSWSAFQDHIRDNPIAYGLALSGAIAWGLYSNLARRWSAPDGGGAVELFLPATGIVLLGLRLMSTEPHHWSLGTVGEACGLALVTSVSYALWDVAMRKGNLLLVVACSYFTPLLSTMVSCLYLNVATSPRLWTGCALLVTGSLLTWLSVSTPPPATLDRDRSHNLTPAPPSHPDLPR